MPSKSDDKLPVQTAVEKQRAAQLVQAVQAAQIAKLQAAKEEAAAATKATTVKSPSEEFPPIPAAGATWTDAERAQALAAYSRALKESDPDAGRLRTLISIHSAGDRAQLDMGPVVGVEFKA